MSFDRLRKCRFGRVCPAWVMFRCLALSMRIFVYTCPAHCKTTLRVPKTHRTCVVRDPSILRKMIHLCVLNAIEFRLATATTSVKNDRSALLHFIIRHGLRCFFAIQRAPNHISPNLLHVEICVPRHHQINWFVLYWNLFVR